MDGLNLFVCGVTMPSKRKPNPPLKRTTLSREEHEVLATQANQIFNQAADSGRSFKDCLVSVLLSGLIIGSQINNLDESRLSK